MLPFSCNPFRSIFLLLLSVWIHGVEAVGQADQLCVSTGWNSIFFPACAARTPDGKYLYLDQLGEGSSSLVIRGMSFVEQRFVAIKVFNPREHTESEAAYNAKIHAEYRVASTLNHENVIQVLELIEDGSKILQVMEYCPYDLLSAVLSRTMTENDIAFAFIQVLRGVAYLHARGVAHRDLKVDNVVFNEQGIMKLVDFGSAAVFKPNLTEHITLSKGVIGTDIYLAPEVHSGLEYDPRPVDVWALALIFCLMTLERFPWPVPTRDREFSTSFVSKIRPRLLKLLPRGSRYIIGRMLDPDPATRAGFDEIFDHDWISNAGYGSFL